MEPITSEIQYTKNPTALSEPQKRKKYARKKDLAKPSKLPPDFTESAYLGSLSFSQNSFVFRT
jgi:hypothetical protein